MKLHILSASNPNDLEKQAGNYTIHQVGSLTVSNGQFYLAIIGDKVEPETKVTKKPTSKGK